MSLKPYVIFYVAQVPGEGGVDWGYTLECTKAKPLSIYWQRRFSKDCERVGTTAQFISI